MKNGIKSPQVKTLILEGAIYFIYQLEALQFKRLIRLNHIFPIQNEKLLKGDFAWELLICDPTR